MTFSKKSRIKSMFLTVTVCLIGLSASAAGTMRVACLGDSNTRGYGLPENQAYPAQLEDVLQGVDERWTVHNFGVNGASVLRNADNPFRFQPVIDIEPDVIIFMFGQAATRGPNRGLIDDHFVSDYVGVINELSQLPGRPQMWLGYPLHPFSSAIVSPVLVAQKIIPLIDQVAAETGLPVIDFHTPFLDSRELFQSDGLHPNASGARQVAELIASKLLPVRVSPDFTGDFKVDMADLTELIEHFGTGDPAFDLAPVPDGDGLVDYLDLEAFMEFWGEELALIGHWTLDEAGGKIAQNAADWRTPGMVEGDPFWLPLGGHDGGALELDGIDDHVGTDFRLNPTDGPFSVFAWVKGGAPGQVIISQADSFGSGETWLSTDPLDGKLMSEIVTPPAGRNVAPPIVSEFVITDGAWHHIGFVWDGAYRHLYADGVEVAQDIMPLTGLRSLDGGLYFGVADSLTPTTLWAGLIDDIRIYNRALAAEQIEAMVH